MVMHSDAEGYQALARRLGDKARWVEFRDTLLSGKCEVYGLETEQTLSFAMRDSDCVAVFIVGKPENAAVLAAVQDCRPACEVIAPPEAAGWLQELLPDWQRERVLVHTLANTQHLPEIPAGAVRFLDPGALSHLTLPDDLREELVSGAEWSPIAATFVDGQPVSFCYAGAVTEAYWDVAIDTLPEHRRRGYAVLSATYMIEHMRAQGKQPVWQAVKDNPASWKLAQKLGFVQVDELVLFNRQDNSHKDFRRFTE